MRIALFLIACALAAPAYASYGQMRLAGAVPLLAFGLAIAWAIVVDVLVVARVFRSRAMLVLAIAIGIGALALLAGALAIPGERDGFFNGAPGGAMLVVLAVCCTVVLPFMLVGPIAQYRALRDGRGSPAWITLWLAAQVALLPGFFAMASLDERFGAAERAEAFALGRDARPGGFAALLARADAQRERVWGTPWTLPMRQQPPTGYVPRFSQWMAGLAGGIDASTPIAANEALAEADRAALGTLLERHLMLYATPQLRTKLLWDALEPGAFARQLAPHGLGESGVVGEELLPLLLDRLEQDRSARLCPDGRMDDADRALLRELVARKARAYDEARARDEAVAQRAADDAAMLTQAPWYERLPLQALRALGDLWGGSASEVPDWGGYPARVDRLCRPAA